MKRNLLIGFGISLIILIISSVASYTSIRNLLGSAKLVDHSNKVVLNLEQVISTMKDAETGQRGFLITGLSEFLDPYTGSYEQAIGIISEVKTLTADNIEQQKNIRQLNEIIKKRFSKLQLLIDRKKAGTPIEIADMREGKVFMDSVRQLINEMQLRENVLLAERTNELRNFAQFTPVLIMLAALAAVIITIMFYIKMSKDIDVRTRLQDELVSKDAAIAHRLEIIRNVSSSIAAGDYAVRVPEENESDNIGSIAGSLNNMAAALDRSFTMLSKREWIQAGEAGLSQAIMGSETMNTLAEKMISFIAGYTGSQVAALYINQHNGGVRLEYAYGVSVNRIKQHLQQGEGLAGQCLLAKKRILLEGITEDDFNMTVLAGEIKPVNLIAFPLIYEGTTMAVIELGSFHPYTEKAIKLFERIEEYSGIAIDSILNRQKIQELLEETQSQAEELMSQQAELEQINAELEEQAQQLQSSEEELKVQSEELIETNTLLEERSAALEQRNQLVMKKNAEIEKKAEELALSTKYKSEFLANMSHELRTPLNSILLLSRLMSENNERNLSEEQVQYANVIQSSGNGLLQLIDEILDLSKIESGKMTVEYQEIKITDITAGLNALFAPVAKQQGLEWIINISDDVPEYIETDRQRLEQVLKNLLSNAFKFTSKGSVQLLVNSPAGRSGYVCFTVKDTGIGISPDKQELIFEAFQQEDGSTRRKYGGTGLGLSISRELAKLLGGMITLTSTPTQGSQFACCIPVNNIVPAAGDVKEPGILYLAPPPQLPASAEQDKFNTDLIPDDIPDDRDTITSQDKLILIIEDDIPFAESLRDYARQKGYKVLVAVRGDTGIEMAIKYLPAGILLDIQLPVKNGWQVMEALKKNGHTRHIPVHIMSSFEVRKQSLEQGAIDFINKPIAPEQFSTIFEKIEFVLGKKGKKVLIIEENEKHAKALAYYLNSYQVNAAIQQSVKDSIASLYKEDVNCVILDMGISDKNADELMESIRKNEGLEDLPIIVFTGKSLSQPDEFKLKKYADAIVMKTANSYQRILDEVSLFLHLMQDQQNKKEDPDFEKMVLQENVLKGKNVLLADDDVRNIYSMTKTLEKYSMNVIPAMDGNEALQLIKMKAVDVVLMDMMMPNMDGYESIRAIRNIPELKNIPVIAVTAKAMSGDREKCIAAGASDYISKPVDMDQLISLLRIWLYEKGY